VFHYNRSQNTSVLWWNVPTPTNSPQWFRKIYHMQLYLHTSKHMDTCIYTAVRTHWEKVVKQPVRHENCLQQRICTSHITNNSHRVQVILQPHSPNISILPKLKTVWQRILPDYLVNLAADVLDTLNDAWHQCPLLLMLQVRLFCTVPVEYTWTSESCQSDIRTYLKRSVLHTSHAQLTRKVILGQNTSHKITICTLTSHQLHWVTSGWITNSKVFYTNLKHKLLNHTSC